MNPRDILLKQFLEVVENQLRDNKPPITTLTLSRLKQDGYEVVDAKKMIAACVGVSLFEVMEHNRPFDQVKYEAMLKRLPELPE